MENSQARWDQSILVPCSLWLSVFFQKCTLSLLTLANCAVMYIQREFFSDLHATAWLEYSCYLSLSLLLVVLTLSTTLSVLKFMQCITVVKFCDAWQEGSLQTQWSSIFSLWEHSLLHSSSCFPGPNILPSAALSHTYTCSCLWDKEKLLFLNEWSACALLI